MSVVEEPPEVRSLHVLHHKVVDAAGRAEVDRLDDVVMTQLRSHLGLGRQLLEEAGVGSQARLQDLDGHQAVHAQLAGLVDRAHRPLPEERDDLVLA